MRKLIFIFILLFLNLFRFINAATQNPKLITLIKDKQTVYLFGTVHGGKADFYPFSDAINNAFKQANALAVEFNINDEKNISKLQAAMQGHIQLDSNQSLDKLLSENAIKKIDDIMGHHAMVNYLQPWLVSFMLTEKLQNKEGYYIEYGVDKYFINQAQNSQKLIIDLEKPEDQLAIFTNLSIAEQAKILEFDNDMDIDLKKAYQAWQTGDEDLAIDLQKQLKEHAPNENFYAEILTKRNINMSNKIIELNQSYPVLFVTIGTLHILGNDSVSLYLQKNGYSIVK